MRINRAPTLPRDQNTEEYRLAVLSTFRDHAQSLSKAEEQCLIVACSDETTALTTGLKVTFRWPWTTNLSEIRASLSTAQTSGSIFTVDVRVNGTTIFTTKPTIDNTEKTTETAATAAVISSPVIVRDSEVTIYVHQVGTAPAGLKVSFLGSRQ